MQQRHLRTLHVQENCDQEQLRKAFLKRARETHPDKNGTAQDFVAVKEAYEYLKENFVPTKKRRKVYNQLSQSIHLTIGLTLKEVYEGGEPRIVKYLRKQICVACNGIFGTQLCQHCDGEQFLIVEDEVVVAFEKSCFTGTKFVFHGKSHDLGPDFQRGRVIVSTFEIGHPQFERFGSNLVHYIVRPFAVLHKNGVEIVKLPSGHKIRFRRRAFSVRKNQQFFVRRIEIDGAGFFPNGKLIVILCASITENFDVRALCRQLIAVGKIETIPKAYSLVHC